MLHVKPERPLSRPLLTLIRSLDSVAKQLDIAYFVIGATARDIVLEHVYGLETTRATRDVDFAVAVSSWDEFDRLKEQLIATQNFIASENAHRLNFNDGGGPYPLDLVPFGGVEREGEIAWPPKGEFVMNVMGYADARDSALDVEIEPGFMVKIVSLPAMATLKILAWNDRPEREKHASDVLLILKNYHGAGQLDRLYDQDGDLLERYGYDIQLAGAALLGRDAKRGLVEETQAQVLAVLTNGRNFDQFSSQMIRSQRAGAERVALLIEAFLDGIRN